MREKVVELKIMNKNKGHSSLKMSSVKTRTAHSRDRWHSLENLKQIKLLSYEKIIFYYGIIHTNS
jgi:hypothetical protein